MLELIGIVAVATVAYFYGKRKGEEDSSKKSSGKWEGWPRD